MCAIAGLLSLDGGVSAAETEVARRMITALAHRGPDSQKVAPFKDAVLANARLKIIDLSSAADMPLSNEDRTVWITYNGEVTNFQELKDRFALGRKHSFRSRSDSEVLVHLYEEIGMDMLRHLTGHFALCLYDSRRGKAFLVRDFYGVRPLFYTVRKKRLYFASEIKGLLEAPDGDGLLDEEALYHFFSLGYMPGEMTPFKDIRELPGGSLIEVDLKSGYWEEKSFHEIRFDSQETGSEAETAANLRKVLSASVQRNLIADVPIGLTLSGGVDSSSLLMLSKELGKRLHTFSIEMDDHSFDESEFQRVMVEHADPIHHRIPVTAKDVADSFVSHVAYLDEPSGNGGAIPMFLLAREARKHVKVLLSGEGGDEIFNAYETHRAYGMRRLYRRWVPPAVRSLARSMAARLPTSHRKLSFDFVSKRFTAGAELGVPESHLYWRHVLGEDQKRRLMPKANGFRPTEALFRETFDDLDFDDELDRLAYLDIIYYFVGDLMVKNDRMIMASSIEARFPYMDRHVVEAATRIPSRMKVRGLSGRLIQKKAMADLLPRKILDRSNMGLEMPHAKWFLGGLRGLADTYFNKKVIGRSGLLDPKEVISLWDAHRERKADNGRSLWCILSFLVWFDLFVHNKDYKDHLA